MEQMEEMRLAKFFQAAQPHIAKVKQRWLIISATWHSDYLHFSRLSGRCSAH